MNFDKILQFVAYAIAGSLAGDLANDLSGGKLDVGGFPVAKWGGAALGIWGASMLFKPKA